MSHTSGGALAFKKSSGAMGAMMAADGPRSGSVSSKSRSSTVSGSYKGIMATMQDISAKDQAAQWYVGWRADKDCYDAMKGAKQGDYFIRLAVRNEPHTLEFWCRDYDSEIVEQIEVKVNKKKEASFTLFKNKYSDLTALVTGLHKKPLKGKVQGRKKNLPIGLAITFPAEQGGDEEIASLPTGDARIPAAHRSSSLPGASAGAGGNQPSQPDDAADFGFPKDEGDGFGPGRLQRKGTTTQYGFGSTAGDPTVAAAAATAAASSAVGARTESFGGFGDDDDDDGPSDYLDADTGASTESEETNLPAWYAGTLSRDNANRMVESAASGDFLIRESSRGDKCVICVNDEGHLLNLLVNVTQDGKYQFAGKDMDSLHDVVFMLRQKPLQGKFGKLPVGAPVLGLAAIVKKQNQEKKALERMHHLRTSTYSSIAADSTGELATRASILTSQDGSLYDEVTLGGGPNGPGEYDDEDLYMPPTDMGGGGGGGGDDDGDTDSIDLIDANVPSHVWIAEYEEKYEASKHGGERLTNAEFMANREAARGRAETAAKDNAEKMARRAAKTAQWKKVAVKEDEENFFEYQDASGREFGNAPIEEEEDGEDIYDSVPRWFVGAMDRDECDSIVLGAQSGGFLIRESSQGGKFVLVVNYGGKAKNFQIVFSKGTDAKGRPSTTYEFSGKKHASLELVVDYSIKHQIHKSGLKIPLTESARM